MYFIIGFLIGVVLGTIAFIIRTKRNEKKQIPYDFDDEDWITEEEFRCEECGGVEFLNGPSGGSFGNFKCANEKCGAKYNHLGPFGIERIK